MAAVYAFHTGSNTSPYDTAAKAATTFGTAAAFATAGDHIRVDKTHQETLGGTTTWTLADGVDVHVVDTTAGDAPAVMGTGGWIGGDANFTFTLTGSGKHRVTGLTIRCGGSGGRPITVGNLDGEWTCEDLYLWSGNTNSGTDLVLGMVDVECFLRLIRPTFRFGATTQSVVVSGGVEILGGSIASAGSVPANVFSFATADMHRVDFQAEGIDLSYAGSGNVFEEPSAPNVSGVAVLRRCKLGSGYVLLSSSATNRGSLEAFALDCAVGDTHISMHHANVLGSTVVDTGIFVTAHPGSLSWKIVTTANASPRTPYFSPWLSPYNDDVSTSITPYIEILRDGSATAYQNDEVYPELTAKQTSGSPIATYQNNRMAILGTPANIAAGAGTGSWTGEGGTAWSGKLEAASAFTPAEIGHIRARIAVPEPSITLYAHPTLLGLAA